jgi:ferredoxin
MELDDGRHDQACGSTCSTCEWKVIQENMQELRYLKHMDVLLHRIENSC